jgi:hypothetical protein
MAKKCSECGSDKTYTRYGEQPQWHRNMERNLICTKCYMKGYNRTRYQLHKEDVKRYYEAHKEEIRTYARAWRARNPGYMKAWHTRNPDYSKTWYLLNRERTSERSRKQYQKRKAHA